MSAYTAEQERLEAIEAIRKIEKRFGVDLVSVLDGGKLRPSQIMREWRKRIVNAVNENKSLFSSDATIKPISEANV